MNSARIPPVIDVEFSARCNLKCGFCFGPADDRSVPDLSTQFWKDCLGWLHKAGAEGIVVSGGEPTLRRDIVDLLAHAKALGLNTVMSSHGQLPTRLLACVPYLDWIALPIDAVSESTLREMRGRAWGVNDAIDVIRHIRTLKPDIGIKLGTVATKVNSHELPNLAKELVSSAIQIDTWKIYQYTPRRKFRDRASIYWLSDEEYNELITLVRRDLAKAQFEFTVGSIESRRGAYLFVYPNGDVSIPNVGNDLGDVLIGNLAVEGPAALERVSGVSADRHRTNFQTTYPTLPHLTQVKTTQWRDVR